MAEEKETVQEETNETKTENSSSSNGGSKYHLIQPNFTMSIVFAAIACGLELIHSILAACGVSGDLAWMIINAIFTAGAIVVGVLALKLFLKETNPKRGEDLASFIISLCAFIIAFCLAIWFGADCLRNTINFFRSL